MAAYQGPHHWETQKKTMLEGLLASGKSPAEAQAIVAQITGLQRDAGNVPAGHSDWTTPNDTITASGIRPPSPSIAPPSVPPVAPPAQTSGAPVAPMASAAPAPQVAPPPQSPSTLMPGSPSIFDNPDAVESVMGMGGLNRQLSQAEAMRDKDFADGRYVANGKMYVAATPLEHIGTVANKLKGQHDAKKYGAEIDESKKRLIELLRQPRSPVASSAEGPLPVAGRMLA